MLFVPTSEEGHEVESDIVRALKGQTADFTVVIGYFAGDLFEPSILSAAETDSRILPLEVEAQYCDWTAMTAAFALELERLQAERGKRASDCMYVALPDLIIRR